MPSVPANPIPVLIVEDDAGFRDVLTLGLKAEGIETFAVGSLAEAKNALTSRRFAAVVSDMRLGAESGLDLLMWMTGRGLNTPSVIMTAFATTETTVKALSLGAVDFLTKARNDIKELVKVVQGILAKSVPSAAAEAGGDKDLLGTSDGIRRIQALIGKFALADSTVLITGESGTGKEVAARLIHRYSSRSKGPFIAVNCGALPENLLESELFGYEKGSFTGANAMKRGLFEEAHGGVIFLDEIGDMPLPLQVKLLRVLQELKVRRVGSHEEMPIDVRVVCTTNRDVQELSEKGEFRRDLFYRLNILHIVMPPLRERPDDLPLFISHFLSSACERMGKPPMSLAPDAMEMLRSYSFPGNIRELKNLMERFAALGSGGMLGSEVFPDNIHKEFVHRKAGRPAKQAFTAALGQLRIKMPLDGFDLDGFVKSSKRYFIREALSLSGGNKSKAAHLLGMGFRPFRYMVDEGGGIDGLPENFPDPSQFPLKQTPHDS